jgi:hypothetical protein
MTAGIAAAGPSTVAWQAPCETRRSSAARGRRSCAAPCSKGHSKDSIHSARSASGPRHASASAIGQLGCILPGQVLSPSPGRCTSSGVCKKVGLGSRYSPGRAPRHGRKCASLPQCLDRYECLSDPPIAVDCPDGVGSTVDCSAGYASPTLLRTIRGQYSGDAVKGHEFTEERGAVCSGVGDGCEHRSDEISAPCGERGIQSAATRLNVAAPGDEVDRLIARCMTQERPAALVQASAALLDACFIRFGEQVPVGQKRSDRIRAMLRLTDELRRYNADLTKQGVPTCNDGFAGCDPAAAFGSSK